MTVAAAGHATAAPTGRLVITGNGMRYADIVLSSRTSLVFDNGDAPGSFGATYRGDYAGFALATGDASNRILAGALLVRGWVSPIVPSYRVGAVIGRSRLTVAPGRYRVYLFSDGPAEVSVLASSGLPKALRVSAVKPAAGMSATRVDVPGTFPAGGGYGTASVPIAQTARGLVTVAAYSSGEKYTASDTAFCIRSSEAPSPCLEGDGGMGASAPSDGGAWTNWTYTPNEISPGRYTVDIADTTVAGRADVRSGFVITIPNAT